jgi:hypothetical protein
VLRIPRGHKVCFTEGQALVHTPATAPAQAATAAHPAWAKGWYRLGRALAAAQRWGPAAAALERAAALDPGSAAAVAGPLAAAQRAAARADARAAAQATLAHRHAAWAAGRAREAAGRASLREQLEGGMAAQEWELEDWEWRPTWLPPPLAAAAACSRASASAAAAPGAPEMSSPPPRFKSDAAARRLLAGLSHALADVEGPARCAALARDGRLMGWYFSSLRAALLGAAPAVAGLSSCGGAVGASGGGSGGGGGGHVLVLGGGAGGALALLAAAAGARRVTLVERSPLALAAARALVDANAAGLAAAGCDVALVPAPLARCCPPGWEPRAGDDRGGGGGADGAEAPSARLHVVDGPPADVVVTDLGLEPG